MDRKRWTKVILFGAAFLSFVSCAVVVIWVPLWTQLYTYPPPEHVYVEVLSPDGSQIARFSVKYQGLSPWFPTDIEPYCYVTIVGTERAGILLRKTEHHGDIKSTFTELARKHAPWALEQIASQEWGSSQ
jgi:hypothetical protein